MFSTHVTKKLSAYCLGELAADESRQVAEHLIACKRCRVDHDGIKLGVKLAERLPELSAPDSLWHELEARMITDANRARVATHKQSPFALTVWRPTFAGVAAGLVLAVGLWAAWVYTREARPFWEVARLNGAPRIGSAPIGETGQLGVGQWLETDNSSRAQIDVGSIGSVDIDPNTRVRLVETKATEHRLELKRGRMSARIWAPPRLFFVDTPSGVAADLGCAYTLEVDDEGAGVLHVTSGWVALQLKDRESMVPAGATCATRPGIGPGTPYFDDASQFFRQALATFDFEPESQNSSKTANLDLILKEARPRDTLTLWHLLERVEGNDRERVYDRMAVLTPPPDGVTREGVLQLDDQVLQQWKDNLTDTWTNESALRKTWIGLWTRALGKVRGMEGKK